ncbi:MAG: alkaline phosphatase D family protein [bacterium]
MKKTHFFCIIIVALLIFVPASEILAQTITHGPIIGAVTSAAARIAVRVDAPAEVKFELDTQTSFASSFFTTSKTAAAEQDFFVVLDVDGLSPDTRYYYRAVLNNTPSQTVNEFQTFPVEGQRSTFTFAFGACQQNFQDPNSNIGRVFPLIAQDRPRFFLELGDWTYPDTTDDGSNPQDYFNIDFSRVQSNYRTKYDPTYPMSEIFKIMPIDYVYDDHDYSNDNSDRTFPARENSLRGYQEMFPHYPLANKNNGLWHKFTFGNADFFVLDTRTQRSPNITPFKQDSNGRFFYEKTPGHLILDSDPTISGQLQMDWLIQELQASTADWKFVCTTVTFNPSVRALVELALFFQGSSLENFIRQFGFSSLADVAISLADSWNGFANSVERLVKAVNENNIDNVIVLSGDTHTAAIDDGANAIFPEIMAGALDRTNSRLVALGQLFGVDIWNQGGQTLSSGNFNSHYGRITVFAQDSVRLELIDEFGQLITSYTHQAGRVASRVALTVAVERLDFGEVAVGDSATSTLLLINTGADTVFINNISSSVPEFIPSLTNLSIPPGVRNDVVVAFAPQTGRVFQGEITIGSNDPDGPLVLSVRGSGTPPTSVDQAPAVPNHFALNQNYPNPFNPATRITYELASESRVDLRIYNQLGQEVKALVNFQKQLAGSHSAQWNGKDNQGRLVGSGVYFYRLNAGAFTESRKMLLLR